MLPFFFFFCFAHLHLSLPSRISFPSTPLLPTGPHPTHSAPPSPQSTMELSAEGFAQALAEPSLDTLLSSATQTLLTAVSVATAVAQPPNYDFNAGHNHVCDVAGSQASPWGTLPLLRWLVSFSFWVLGFVTMTVPTGLYRLLSWSFTFHLTFTTLLIAIAFVCFLAWAVIRYRILTKYSRLPDTSPGKHAATFDLHPDSPFKSLHEEKETMTYPDEFLSAFLSSIKIFGYLEQPVFHELARHLQTRRLPAGDTILQNPDLERSFYIVVDGRVQVYERVVKDEEDDHDQDDTDAWDDDPDHGYQLLNEVRNGGTLSSLFTILSLFTEHVKLRHEDEPLKEFKRADSRSRTGEEAISPTSGDSTKWKPSSAHGPGLRTKVNVNTRTSPLSNPDHMAVFDRDSGTGVPDAAQGIDDTMPQQAHGQRFEDGEQDLKQQEHQGPRTRPTSTASTETRSFQAPRMKRRVIVAKAMVDTTLAVIPAEAFHRLTQKFPQAAAHIVQVILIRFQRVTLLTGHKYLGLTKELLRMERSINEIGSYGLPSQFFRPGTMEYLKTKFRTVREESDDDDQPLTIRVRHSRKKSMVGFSPLVFVQRSKIGQGVCCALRH